MTRYAQILVAFPHPNKMGIYIIPDELVTEEVEKEFTFSDPEKRVWPRFNSKKWTKIPGCFKIGYDQDEPWTYNLATFPSDCVITRTFTFNIC